MALTPLLIWQTELPNVPGMWLRQDDARTHFLMVASTDVDRYGNRVLTLCLSDNAGVHREPRYDIDWWRMTLKHQGIKPLWAKLPSPYGPTRVSKNLPGSWVRDPKDGTWFIDLPIPEGGFTPRRVRVKPTGTWNCEWNQWWGPKDAKPEWMEAEDETEEQSIEATIKAVEEFLADESWKLPSTEEEEAEAREREEKDAMHKELEELRDFMNKLDGRLDNLESIDSNHHHNGVYVAQAVWEEVNQELLQAVPNIENLLRQFQNVMDAEDALKKAEAVGTVEVEQANAELDNARSGLATALCTFDSNLYPLLQALRRWS